MKKAARETQAMNQLDEKIIGETASPPSHGLPERKSPVFGEIVADLLMRGHAVCFRATGRSMYPTIREGEKIAVEPVSLMSVAAGDILLYRTAWGGIAHRVVRIEPDTTGPMFIFRGDALAECDGPVEPHRVLGRVAWVERNGRRIQLFGARARLRRWLRACASRARRWLRARSPHMPESVKRSSKDGRLCRITADSEFGEL